MQNTSESDPHSYEATKAELCKEITEIIPKHIAANEAGSEVNLHSICCTCYC